MKASFTTLKVVKEAFTDRGVAKQRLHAKPKKPYFAHLGRGGGT